MVNGQVLILNQDYQPLTISNVRKSVILLFLGKAEMLHDLPERRLRTVSSSYEYPSVIRLLQYVRFPYRTIVLSRRNILKRDNHKCQYCGTTEALTIDHVIPKSRGGGDSWENLTTACTKCNTKKGNRTPKEAEMPLRQKPFRPNHIMFLRNSNGTVQEQWKPYLYM